MLANTHFKKLNGPIIFAVTVVAVFWQPAHSGGLFGDVVNVVVPGLGTELDKANKKLKEINPIYQELDESTNKIYKETKAQIGYLPLAEWIRTSRNEALAAGTALIPPHIRNEMLVLFSKELLTSVRYRVGWGNELALPANAFRFGGADGITLDYVIVFLSRESAQNLELWAHELGHVKQYKDWGIDEFAKRYLRSRTAVEKDAEKAANMFRKLE